MKQNEVGVVLTFILQDDDGSPYDLSRAISARLYIERGGEIIVREAEIVSPAGGVVQYTTQAGDLSVPDENYRFQVVVDFDDGTHLVSDIVMEHIEGTLEGAYRG